MGTRQKLTGMAQTPLGTEAPLTMKKMIMLIKRVRLQSLTAHSLYPVSFWLALAGVMH